MANRAVGIGEIDYASDNGSESDPSGVPGCLDDSAVGEAFEIERSVEDRSKRCGR